MFDVDTPSYIIDTDRLEKNLKILKGLKDRCGCKILLASKAYANYETFALIGRYLDGVTSSSLHEARLGAEEMGKEVHIFSPAYKEKEIDEIIRYCGHIVFNSFGQWEKYTDRVQGKCSCGLRINHEYSERETDIYNPCIAGSRFGIKAEDMEKGNIDGIEGLHFHTMCEQNSD
ncbi:MAG: carboxynorspermidine decarboxylase, partial [Firmicutes bacterium]|nr:carboxynorspermidine decarboxylase [Bacillota bacterium]